MRLIMSLLLTAVLATPAFAAFEGPGAGGNPGGFQGPGAMGNETNVQAVKNMRDDTWVTLTGNVVSKVPGSKDKYTFKDASGEIIVEIDNKYFRGQTVTPANTVRITGEVDKDFPRPVEIDVKRIEVIK